MRIGIARALVVAAAGLWLAGCSTAGNLTNPFASNPPGADAHASAPAEADSEPTGSIGPRLSAEDDDLSQGKAQYRANNFNEAEKHFRRAAERHPRDEEAWLGLAASYDRLHRFTEADQAYDRAIAIVGATAEILNNQGYSYMLRHDYKRAHVTLKAAQRKDPHNKYVQNNLHLLEQSARRGVAID
jgi:Flp pilus assembly protein TadD